MPSHFSGQITLNRMSTLALLKKGGQFMLAGRPDPTSYAVALGVHLQEEVELVAAFPGKVLFGDL